MVSGVEMLHKMESRDGEQDRPLLREWSPSLTKAFSHHPLHYIYALSSRRCKGAVSSCLTLKEQMEVEMECFNKFSSSLRPLAPHPDTVPSPDASGDETPPTGEGQAAQKLQLEQSDDNMDYDGMPIEDRDFLWQRAMNRITLNRSQHITFLSKHLDVPFSSDMMDLAASRPWLVYWMTHGLALLGALPRATLAERILNTLDACWDYGVGGWGGGSRQQAHLADTYAAAAALVEAELLGRWLDGAEGERKRQELYETLMSLKSDNGGFHLHKGGEVDIRGAYCAIATASMLHMLTEELMNGVAVYVASCQGYEGGIGGEPGLEAHGGHTYCGLAALCIMGRADALDLDRLLHWAVTKQMGFEGGFQGRTGKLVDSCYSFWLGGIFPLLAEAFRQQQRDYPLSHCWMSSQHLQQYILCCCQALRGGIEDKPKKGADLYHTCYALSGLSIAQHAVADGELGKAPYVYGVRDTNLLERTDIFYNVCVKQMNTCRMQLCDLPSFQNQSSGNGIEGPGPLRYAEWCGKFTASDRREATNDADWADPESEVESA